MFCNTLSAVNQCTEVKSFRQEKKDQTLKYVKKNVFGMLCISKYVKKCFGMLCILYFKIKFFYDFYFKAEVCIATGIISSSTLIPPFNIKGHQKYVKNLNCKICLFTWFTILISFLFVQHLLFALTHVWDKQAFLSVFKEGLFIRTPNNAGKHGFPCLSSTPTHTQRYHISSHLLHVLWQTMSKTWT